MTPGPVERKFARVEQDGEDWAVVMRLDPHPCMGLYHYKGDAERRADQINAAHESAIAEAVKAVEHRLYTWAADEVNSKVKAAVERCAKIAELRMHSILNPAYLQPERKHSDDIAFGEIKSARAIAAEIRAQGATHG